MLQDQLDECGEVPAISSTVGLGLRVWPLPRFFPPPTTAENKRRLMSALGYSVTSHFCPICGSTDHIGISVGCFVDPAFPRPKRAIWTQNKHHWVVLPDEIAQNPCFRTGNPDTLPKLFVVLRQSGGSANESHVPCGWHAEPCARILFRSTRSAGPSWTSRAARGRRTTWTDRTRRRSRTKRRPGTRRSSRSGRCNWSRVSCSNRRTKNGHLQ